MVIDILTTEQELSSESSEQLLSGECSRSNSFNISCGIKVAQVGRDWFKPKKIKRFLLTLGWYGTNSGDSLEIKVA